MFKNLYHNCSIWATSYLWKGNSFSCIGLISFGYVESGATYIPPGSIIYVDRGPPWLNGRNKYMISVKNVF